MLELRLDSLSDVIESNDELVGTDNNIAHLEVMISKQGLVIIPLDANGNEVPPEGHGEASSRLLDVLSTDMSNDANSPGNALKSSRPLARIWTPSTLGTKTLKLLEFRIVGFWMSLTTTRETNVPGTAYTGVSSDVGSAVSSIMGIEIETLSFI